MGDTPSKLHRRGLLSQVASRTLHADVQAALGERDAVPGVIACVPTFGSLAHRHPHLHVRLTDGALRRDGSFVPLPPPDPAVREEAWRRAVLARFVRRGGLEADAAAGMLAWPHAGCGADVGQSIEDREGLLRVARTSALSTGGRLKAARRRRARRGRVGLRPQRGP
jgi:hypothetical protein